AERAVHLRVAAPRDVERELLLAPLQHVHAVGVALLPVLQRGGEVAEAVSAHPLGQGLALLAATSTMIRRAISKTFSRPNSSPRAESTGIRMRASISRRLSTPISFSVSGGIMTSSPSAAAARRSTPAPPPPGSRSRRGSPRRPRSPSCPPAPSSP